MMLEDKDSTLYDSYISQKTSPCAAHEAEAQTSSLRINQYSFLGIFQEEYKVCFTQTHQKCQACRCPLFALPLFFTSVGTFVSRT